MFWLDDQPLKVGDAVKLRINSMDAEARVQAIERVIDTESLAGGGADAVNRNEVAEIVLRTRSMLALDEARANPETGSFRDQPQFPHCRRRCDFHGRLSQTSAKPSPCAPPISRPARVKSIVRPVGAGTATGAACIG